MSCLGFYLETQNTEAFCCTDPIAVAASEDISTSYYLLSIVKISLVSKVKLSHSEDGSRGDCSELKEFIPESL